ncbi:hypothetical protein [Jannaschia pohangensis]|uniref:DoxX-like family protein n=1 Tax=Jannaschia pohangensis TaxID=390807 RepID=A0A1I3GJD8_9RHOB|nr:hypothetical protein [Jannaschia pohangensis]SFI23598.1 hypothetical protein SAMN04488095_0220 [Jannaschia pohangensis]
MRRLHFYVMGAIALLFGLASIAEYVMVSYGLRLGWLASYPPEQIEWLSSLPAWVHGVWGAQALLALVGALCLLAHLRPAVWMLAFSFLSLAVLALWAVAFAQPGLISVTGGGTTPWIVIGCVLLLNLLLYVYARQEKQRGEVL